MCNARKCRRCRRPRFAHQRRERYTPAGEKKGAAEAAPEGKTIVDVTLIRSGSQTKRGAELHQSEYQTWWRRSRFLLDIAKASNASQPVDEFRQRSD
jgi:hypothetical protein